MIEKVVAHARVLGELGHRKTLLTDELKSLRLQIEDERDFAKSLPYFSTLSSDHKRDLKRSIKEGIERADRMKFLTQQELESVKHLTSKVEKELAEFVARS